MDELTETLRTIDRLRKDEKILCPICKTYYYDVSDSDREYSNYFHCEDPDCKGYIHIEKAIDVE